MPQSFDATVFDVRYKYSNQGSVIPVLVLIKKDSNLPYYCDVGIDGPTMRPIQRGDLVRVTINSVANMSNLVLENNQNDNLDQNYLTILQSAESPYAVQVGNGTCPYCGKSLIRTNYQEMYGRCYSRTCPAQFVEHLQHFTNSIGMYFIGKDKIIFNNLRTRGVLRDYIDIFTIPFDTVKALDNVLINDTDIKAFLDFIKRFKNNINLFQILMGFNIPHITPDDLHQIVLQYDYSNFSQAMYTKNLSKLNVSIRDKLALFFSYDTNVQSLYNLKPIMQDRVQFIIH